MRIKITPQQYKVIKESVINQDVEDFFSDEKGKFHLLAPIPTSRTIAVKVIKRILESENKKYIFGQNVDLNELSLINRLRFCVYLDVVLNETTTRGNNFEGFMAGIFDGYLANDINYRFDYQITGVGDIEQKFLRDSSENPQLKSITKIIKRHPEYNGLLYKDNTPENLRLKNQMLNEPGLLNDYYVFTVMSSGDKNVGYKLDNYVLDKDEIKQILLDPKNNLAPKSGKNAIRISHKNLGNVDFTITVLMPTAEELSDLIQLNNKERAVLSAFGKHSDHIRPDVIKDITKMLPDFIKSLIQAEENYE